MQLPPVEPDDGLLVALPPLPLLAVFDGALTALPDEPVFPPETVLLEVELPEEALPELDGLDDADPVSPVLPEPPDCALPVLVA